MGKKSASWLSIIVVIILLVGLLATATAIKYSTNYQQHASQFNDLNSAADITDTINPDGTMGPATWEGNFSNTLPVAYLGTLDFQVTDPVQGRRPTDTPIPTVTSAPTHTQTQGEDGHPSITPQGNNNQGGPQTVTSLALTVIKAEVHLAHLGLPGTHNQNTATSEAPERPSVTLGKPSMTPGARKDNQAVNKWETLNIGAPQVIDLVQLAKTHSAPSLGLTKLANGRYTEIRLYIAAAKATLADGTKVTLTIPGRANTVRIVEPFVIDSAKKTTLTMDFDAQNSVIKAGDTYLLKPVVAHLLQQNQN